MSKRIISLVNSNRIKPAIAPLGLEYLAAPLRAAGYEVRLLDLCFAEDWRAEIVAHLAAGPSDYWGVTFRNTEDVCMSNGESFIGLVGEMIAALRASAPVPVIVGGVGFSVMPRPLLRRLGADYGVVREGEVTLPRLLAGLDAGSEVCELPGLVYRGPGGITVNPPLAIDLRTIPAHPRSLIDNQRYYAAGGMAGVETKRGCNRGCIHCVEPHAKGRRIRPRRPVDVVDEIEALVAQGVETLHINDSEFNLLIEHAIAVCDELRARGLERKLSWYAYGMPAPFPDALAAAMKAAGCAGMNFGTDSASPRMLERIRRTFTREDLRAAIQTCKRHDLPSVIELLFGFPGETLDDVRDTLSFVQEIDAPLVSLSVGVRVFPNTPLADIIRAEGPLDQQPGLSGATRDNEDLVDPLYYVSPALGPDPLAFIAEFVAGDPRFFPVNGAMMNYNANDVLVDALASGERGAYWSILSRLGYGGRR